ncbi:signal peptidase I [Microbacterium sp. W1N]|uniref:signal peptidase I n=1 Tax=Microbacterium festucae TaxID=2977531 RepID=UPI0021C1A8C4|nr:signal peptidase I [Microbacterium festucae]MCT9820310.1 signal peptidase I [Microbacterium festucae]
MSSTTPAPADHPSPVPRRSVARRGLWPLVRDVLVILLIAVVVSVVVKAFLVRSFYIPSGSMEQTLQKDDRILVDELTPHFTGYERGDVVVFRDPGGWLDTPPEPERSVIVEAVDWVLSMVGISASDSDEHLIKRIIGVPGDHVVCCDALGKTTVNGVPIDETPYLNLEPGQNAPEPVPYDVTVPDDALWVMGDNRDHSRDSRYNMEQPSKGFVPLDNVVGRAFIITWPVARFGLIDFHHDVFSGVPEPDTQ